MVMATRECEDRKVPQHLAVVLPRLMPALLYFRVQILSTESLHAETVTPVPSLGM